MANSFSGQTEFHNFGYEGQLPSPAPEPASYLVVGAGLIGFGFMSKRRVRR